MHHKYMNKEMVMKILKRKLMEHSLRVYATYKIEIEKRLKMAENRRKEYENLLREQYGNLRIHSKIEVK